jgi:pimeloyl-ACP methyl ester carboxylesterase
MNFKIQSLVMALLILVSLVFTGQEAFGQRRKPALGEGDKTQTEKASPGQTQPSPSAQNGRGTPMQTQQRGPSNQQKELSKEEEPVNVVLEVKGEGIQLVATWFPPILDDPKSGQKRKPAATPMPGQPTPDATPKSDVEHGKEVAPFILVPDWTRSRQDLLNLGSFLQSQGHAVIVPDLRGHGESVTMTGSDKPLDYTKFKKKQQASAVADIDQCKRFLQEKNNEGILNIDLLNIVAVGDSAHLAIAWSITDWSWEPVGGVKQGKDVKSLILFSPTEKFAGSSLRKLTRAPLISGKAGTPLPLLVVWGGQSAAAEPCREFVDNLRKWRPEAPQSDDMATRWFKQNLFDYAAPTNMSGVQLAGQTNARQVWAFANNFVAQKVLAFKDQCEWQLRGADAILNR